MCMTKPLLCYMNSECVLESKDTPTAGKFDPIIRPFAMFMCRLCTFSYMYLVTLLALDSLSLADC